LTPIGAARLPRLAEFGGDHDLAAASLQRPPEQFLVVAPAIHVGAVEMVDAELDRAPDQLLAGLVVAGAVGAGQRHAAEPDRQHLRPIAADPALCLNHHSSGRFCWGQGIAGVFMTIAPAAL